MRNSFKDTQRNAPIFSALTHHHEVSVGNFHVPGHKQGNVFDLKGSRYFADILPLDLTEVGHLDDLHDPQGVIREAQQLAAEAFHADSTLFLIGGSTVGNLAAILSVCKDTGPILIQRTCHQSVFHGCILAGVQPIYLPVDFDLGNGLEMPIQLDRLESILKQHSSIQAVIVTSPTYWGMSQPIEAIAACCHQHEIPLIVDEAHGAHFGFHPRLSQSAMQSGADVSIQSTHKMLPSLTMSSMLHLKGNRVSEENVRYWLRILESSSPSYILLASLDLARRFMATEGKEQIERVLVELDQLRSELAHLKILEEVHVPGDGDPFKLTLWDKGASITGYTLQKKLERTGCYLELADVVKSLAVFSLGSSVNEMQILVKRLREIELELLSLPPGEPRRLLPFPFLKKATYSFKEMKGRKKKGVSLSSCKGQVSTEFIVPYPPGIPLVLPGERFTDEVVEFMQHTVQLGGRIRGLTQSSVPMVYVVE